MTRTISLDIVSPRYRIMELISLSRSTPTPHAAATTAGPPGTDLDACLEALGVIVAALAALAARRRSDEDLARLDEAVQALSSAPDSASFAEAASRFEHTLAAAAGNAPLAAGLALLQRSITESDDLAHARGHAAEELVATYTRLAAAIAHRDPDRAHQPPASRPAAPREGDRP
jgi:GntR family transcriptional regulator, transcriptional repressor for pyruvate dehydrogenase complex